ncbi:hypothetical protein ABZU76_15420 [Amycolatopsis sp. NPDC005232]|uniref:hypothetical protein n=1 Tax=Amycolatopsis sp. NPDC005232 TaxID=3157027 RepID=UPI0033B14019
MLVPLEKAFSGGAVLTISCIVTPGLLGVGGADLERPFGGGSFVLPGADRSRGEYLGESLFDAAV